MNSEQDASLDFPAKGVDVSQPYSSQPPGTAPVGKNVRLYEALTQRGRGGSRCGLTRYIPAQIANGLVQHLNYIDPPVADQISGTGGGGGGLTYTIGGNTIAPDVLPNPGSLGPNGTAPTYSTGPPFSTPYTGSPRQYTSFPTTIGDVTLPPVTTPHVPPSPQKPNFPYRKPTRKPKPNFPYRKPTRAKKPRFPYHKPRRPPQHAPMKTKNPKFIQAKAQLIDAGITTLGFDQPVTAGDLLIVGVLSLNINGSVTDSVGTNYTKVIPGSPGDINFDDSGAVVTHLSFWYGIAPASGSNVVTNTDSIGTALGLVIAEYANVKTLTGWNAQPSTTPVPMTTNVVPVLVANSAIIGIFGEVQVGGSGTLVMTPGSKYTMRAQTQLHSSLLGGIVVFGLGLEDHLGVTAAEAATATSDNQGGWGAIGASFKK